MQIRFHCNRVAGFMGKDEYEEAKCNMVLECCHYDMLPTIVEFLLRDDKTKVCYNMLLDTRFCYLITTGPNLLEKNAKYRFMAKVMHMVI